MLHITYTQAKAAAAGLLLSLFLCVACSDEGSNHGPEIPEVQYARVTISLGTADATTPAFTKAGEDVHDIIDDNAADETYERWIADWWVVIVDQQGKVYRVLSNTKQDVWDATTNTDDNEHQIGVDLVIGQTYSFYAFANLNSLSEGSTLVQQINNLDANSDFSAFRKTAVSLLSLDQYMTSNEENQKKAIPMSSYGKTQVVSEDISKNQVELLLIRLLGKVSIEITNATGVAVTVHKLTMGKFRTTGAIYLFPYDAIDRNPDNPNLLVKKEASEYKLLNPSFPTDATPTTGDWVYESQQGDLISYSATEEETNKKNYFFYINETAQENQENGTDDMKVSMDITGEGIERDNTPKSTQFFFIRRNDWIKIPLLISKAETEITYEQKHMPIGGIPDAVTFNPGLTVNNRTLTTDHAGKITISYKLKSINNQNDWQLQYYTAGSATTATAQYCYAAKISDNEVPFLLEPVEKDLLSWWMNTTKPTYGFQLDPGEGNTGSFIVTAQELSYKGEAKIKLNLVATRNTDGQTQTIILPYTLTITNGKEPKGGNS